MPGWLPVWTDSSDGRKSMSNNVEEDDKGINIVVDSMANKIKARSFQHEGPIICRIPDEIRARHDTEYEPKSIAIGPYHRNNGGQGGKINPGLQPMEEIKLRFLNELCKRDGENEDIKDILKTYITAVKEQELNARKRYSESSFEMSSEDFVEMLVLDGCFIVEFLLKRAEGKVGTIPVGFQLRTMPALRRDLLLFENQIPFLILEEIYAKTNNKPTVHTILDLALHYLHKGNITKKMLPKKYQLEKEIHHLLHLSHLCRVRQLDLPKEVPKIRIAETLSDKAMLKSKFCLHSIANFLLIIWEWFRWKCFKYTPPIPSKTRKARTIPTATQLKEAGVHFRKKMISGRDYLDVSFKDGNMEIPTVNIQDNTSSEYRNFLALEQTCKEYGNKFTSYVVFMDNLIDTADDVALLKKSKIIESKLGCEEDVAKFFNEICSGLCFDFDKHYLADMFEEVNKYCNDRNNRLLKVDQWWEELKQKYFRSPWAFFSLMAALILLGLTAAQTTYSVKTFQQTK